METMKNKGLVATLDGLLAYTIAFVSIGMLVLLMTNTNTADVKSSYTLNLWADDIADAIGMSMVDPTDYSDDWYSETSNSIEGDLTTSLNNIADNLDISIEVSGAWTYSRGNIGTAEEIATSTRILMVPTITVNGPGDDDDEYAPSGTFSTITVKVGI